MYFRRCTFGVLVLSGLVLLFLAALSASWVAVTVSICLLFGAVVLPLILEDVQRRTKLLGIVVSASLLLACIPAGQRAWKHIQHRDQYPYVSLRERAQVVNPTQYFADVQRVNETQGNHPSYYPSRRRGGRSRSIESLHRSAVYHFLETPEFGVTRMAYPSLRVLAEPDGHPILLPNESDSVARPVDELRTSKVAASPETLEASLENEHNDFRYWFLDQERLGTVKEVDQVAGFLPHAFTDRNSVGLNKRVDNVYEPIANGQLKLQRLQLLGLLYHIEPIVYVLDTLPELLNAATASTRSLDDFEKRGLEKLVNGEAIYTEQNGNKVHMLGSILNSESCAACHPGPSNQLLGAFSYELEYLAEPMGDTLLTRRVLP